MGGQINSETSAAILVLYEANYSSRKMSDALESMYYFYSGVRLAQQLSRSQSDALLHPYHFWRAFLEEEDEKLAITAVMSGQKSPWNCVQILSSLDVVVFSCPRELKPSKLNIYLNLLE